MKLPPSFYPTALTWPVYSSNIKFKREKVIIKELLRKREAEGVRGMAEMELECRKMVNS